VNVKVIFSVIPDDGNVIYNNYYSFGHNLKTRRFGDETQSLKCLVLNKKTGRWIMSRIILIYHCHKVIDSINLLGS
jgi:hypothetical protein